MNDKKDKKERRPSYERKAIREIQKELGSNYTTALREFNRRKALELPEEKK